jgi:ParB family chromosome partitioning protein
LAKSSARDSIKLTSVDELFSTEESRADSQLEKVLDIPLSEISDFPNHPFKVKADEAMLEMADSVKQYGVLVPALVRPKPDGGYEMVAGHRRKKASELAGKETMPCIVRELDDDAATIIMVDSNLQRESILPSEKAFAYKMKLEAMKRQAGRPTNENRSQVGNNFSSKRTGEVLAEQVGESKNQIFRYIRLTELIPPILEMVDEKQIAFNPAVEISYLAEKEQQDLYNTMQSEDCTPSLAQAQRMKKLSQDGRLSTDVIYSILTEEKPNQKEKFHIQRERIDRFFPKNFTEKQKEDLIVQLLESWYRKRQKEQER